MRLLPSTDEVNYPAIADLLFEHCSDAVLLVDAQMGVVTASSSAATRPPIAPPPDYHPVGHRLEDLPFWPADWNHVSLRAEVRRNGGTVRRTIPEGVAFSPLAMTVRDVGTTDEPLLLVIIGREEPETRFRNLLEHLPQIAVQGYDENLRVTFWNSANERVYGFRADEVTGKRLDELIIPDAMRRKTRRDAQRWLAEGTPPPPSEITLQRKDGSEVQVYSTHVMQHYSSGRREMFCIDVDLTDLRRAQRRLRLAGVVFEETSQGVCITDRRGRVAEVNPAFSAITGFDRSHLVGLPVIHFIAEQHDRSLVRTLYHTVRHHGSYRGEVWLRFSDHRSHPAYIHIERVADEHGGTAHYVIVFSDLTHSYAAKERIDFLLHHDPLTELPNRLLFRLRLDHALDRAHAQNERPAVFCIDIDRFGSINDAYGHRDGDRLLRTVASRMADATREDDTLARFSGDELMVLAEHTADRDEATRLARRLMDHIAAPITLAGRDMAITVSVGIAQYPDDGSTAEYLLRNAEIALRAAQQAGGNGYAFYRKELTLRAHRRATMERDLRRAIETGELELYYQPQVNVHTQTIVGVEALVRWDHPTRGLLSPGAFLPVAAECGLDAPLDDVVFAAACRQAADWHAAGVPFGRIHVNLSEADVSRGDLTQRVHRFLDDAGVAAESIGLELTEEVVMRHETYIKTTMAELSAAGVIFSIDDFGTGFSSLARLKDIPFDMLKIDRAFIRDLAEKGRERDIVHFIIALGHALGQQTVAEGIETLGQAHIVADEGCSTAQGFFFAHPMSAAATAELLSSWNVVS